MNVVLSARNLNLLTSIAKKHGESIKKLKMFFDSDEDYCRDLKAIEDLQAFLENLPQLVEWSFYRCFFGTFDSTTSPFMHPTQSVLKNLKVFDFC